MEIKLYHSLEYTTKGVVPVHLVADSLLANERLIHESLRLLEGIDRNLHITGIVSVENLSNASPLRELLAIAVFLEYQEDLEKQVSDVMQILTGHVGSNTIVTVLVFLVAIYIIDAAIERFMPSKSSKAIKAEYEEKKLLVSRLLNISPEKLDEIVNKQFCEGKQKSLFGRVIRFFAPAKIEPNTKILSNNDIVISAEAIQEIPTNIDFSRVDENNSYDLDAAMIEIHRADRDENKHGWRAVIRAVSEKKVRMELDSRISPDALYGKKRLLGDVTVIEKLQDHGDYEVKVYYLREVRN